MAEELVIVPSNGDGYVELARTKQGRLFKKHILNKGTLLHPNTKAKITIDDTFVETLKTNFAANYCDIVQVPLAGANNEHTEDPDRNIGEVIGIESDADKVYALIDVRKPDAADKLGKTLLGASAMLHLDYEDTKTGKKVGPTLLHACVTNRPYVTGLDNYEEIVAATSDRSHGAVLLTPDVIDVPAPVKENDQMPSETEVTETQPQSLEDLLTLLKTQHNIDVTALQAKAAEGDAATQLSKTLTDALTQAGVIKLSKTDDTTVANDEVVKAVADLAGNNVELSNRVKGLERGAAEHAVDALIASGHVMPKQRDGFVELKLTNPTMFDSLVPAEPVVKLNNETLVTPPEDEKHKANIDAEIARLSSLLGGTSTTAAK